MPRVSMGKACYLKRLSEILSCKSSRQTYLLERPETTGQDNEATGRQLGHLRLALWSWGT